MPVIFDNVGSMTAHQRLSAGLLSTGQMLIVLQHFFQNSDFLSASNFILASPFSDWHTIKPISHPFG